MVQSAVDGRTRPVTTADVEAAVADWTLPRLLRRNAAGSADRPALTAHAGPDAQTLSWAAYRDTTAALAHGLAALGLARGDRMLIMSSARPEHWLVDSAAAHLGAVPCTAYATLSTEQIGYVARHSAAPVVVLEGAAQLARWAPVLDDLPALRRIVLLDPSALPAGDDRFVAYRDVLADGAARHAADPSVFEGWTDAVDQADPVGMIYTSGTTGEPKAVVLTHRNVVWQSAATELVQRIPEHPRSVAYLPLAHIAERVLGIYYPHYVAGHVTICADPLALVATLGATRPHGFFGVPRVWEKFAAGVQGVLAGTAPDRRAAVEAARDLALRVYRLRAAGEPVPDDLRARLDEVDAAVLRPIRASLGLDEATRFGSGAAPIPVSVLEFLGSLGITIVEVWGLSETTGTATTNTREEFRPGTVGRAAPGMEVRLAADGEVLVRGPLVFAGYLQADGSVRPDVDADGWLATGDVGSFDADGFLTITDRKKELLITDSGKNVAPTKVEGLLRAHPLVAQAVAIGDRRPYITALVVLDEDAAPAWARARGLDGSDVVDLPALAAHPEVRRELTDLVASANTALSRSEQVKRFRVLPHTWTAESGELTPKLSLRRRVIVERYAAEIDELYRAEEGAP